MKHIFLSLLLLTFLSACNRVSAEPGPTTLTAQAERSIQQATRIALPLQETQETQRQALTATAQVQATTDAQAVQDILSQARQWPQVFYDSFDEDRGLWTVGKQTGEYGDSEWNIANGVYNWTASAKQSMSWWSNPDMSNLNDFYLSATGRQTTQTSSAYWGLIFQQSDLGQYLVQVNEQQQYAVYIQYLDSWENLIPLTSSEAIQVSAPNRLTIVGQQAHYWLWINDQFITDFRDDRLPGGTTGFLIGISEPGEEATWAFDEIEAKALDLPDATSSPSTLIATP